MKILGETATKIIEAAVEVFKKEGYEKTNVQRLLQAAKISRRTFYKYFKNKDQVLLGVYEKGISLLLEEIERAVSSKNEPMDKLKMGIDSYLAFHESAGPLVLLLHQESMRPTSLLAPKREWIQAKLVELLDQSARIEMEKSLDPLVYYTVIWSLENVSVYLLTKTKRTPADLQRARQLMYCLVERIFAESGSVLPELPLVDPAQSLDLGEKNESSKDRTG